MAPKKHLILRFVHVDNLDGILRRGGMYAPNHTPSDGIDYKAIHSYSVQTSRSVYNVRVGPGGTLHDYVPFYFGPHSPMMLQLNTGQVAGYTEGQSPLVYLVCYAEDVASSGCDFVFTDGHGIAAFTQFFDDLANLGKVDWGAVNLKYWKDSPDDNDRQRRKQAEFLVHRFLPWDCVHGIAVIDQKRENEVKSVLAGHPTCTQPIVKVKRAWYY